MKKNKIIIIGIIFLLFALTSVAYADIQSDVIVSFQIDNPMITINGNTTEIDTGRGTKPVVINGRTLVPIRAIIEAFGGKVYWEEDTQSVFLTIKDDTVKLVIDSNIAYKNNKSYNLDVAPSVINDRTMLPVRFVAESFNLGVSWEDTTKTISIIRDTFDDNEYNYLKSILPDYSGIAYVNINNNTPFFKSYEIINGSFEYYSSLDELGRCDVTFASIAKDLMPSEERKSISSVTPTGWINASYKNVDGGYLYNRCHLIGFQLTGENANERNLITGTRYLNVNGMLPFENKVCDYIEKTGNRVVYRSTPVFTKNNLVADGVLLEAYSVEDNGQGISFCVYCYNVQPDIIIDYLTGKSAYKDDAAVTSIEENITKIYRTPTGKKYHIDIECGGKNSIEILFEDAVKSGLSPCSKCVE